jgi:ubiquinone biosynthesis protein
MPDVGARGSMPDVGARGSMPDVGARGSMPDIYQSSAQWSAPKPDRQTRLTIDDIDGVLYELKSVPSELSKLSSAVMPLRRRVFAAAKPSDVVAPPALDNVQLKANLLRVIRRFLTALGIFSALALGVLWDMLRRRDTPERRAQRLVSALQAMGGTLVKIGQQLAMRVDVLPYVYCKELTKLLDTVKPFPAAQAVQEIERTLGQPLDALFESFDPVPIGSASIACVYQAVLKDGSRVAVKVRRPGVDQMFAADLAAMRWLLTLMEMFTLIRPGLLGNFVRDFENNIKEELDFKREATYQDLFRSYAGKRRFNKRNDYFTAPKVFFEYLSSSVIVQEFISGIWAWEIVAAVEQNDEAALARMRELNIEPKVVAKRLAWAAFWGSMSNFIFHADPHPANLVITSNNEIVFVDFGSCGTISSEKRTLYEEFYYHQQHKDVHSMVQCMLGILEPLPPIDVHSFEKEVELVVWAVQCKLWSKKSKWYERTSANLWLSIFDLTRRYNIPVNLDTVRVFRANMLYDSLAIRMYNDLRIDKEYVGFAKDTAELASKQVKKALKRRFRKGVQSVDLARLQDIFTTGERAFFKLKRFINRRPLDFIHMIEKPVQAVLVIVKTVFVIVGFLMSFTIFVMIRDYVSATPRDLLVVARYALHKSEFQALAILIVLLNIRRLLFRLNDRDISEREIG